MCAQPVDDSAVEDKDEIQVVKVENQVPFQKLHFYLKGNASK